MAPDRGYRDDDDTVGNGATPRHGTNSEDTLKQGPVIHGHSFTLRGILVGLLVGLVICFSNMYFGLQTGWVSTMTMPASLMGFGIFKALSRHLRFPFTPVENVLVQTVAGSMAIMPLGCGFVGVVCPPGSSFRCQVRHLPLVTRNDEIGYIDIADEQGRFLQ